MKARPHIATWDINRLAGETKLNPKTVRRVIEGQGLPSTRQMVIDAAYRLGIALVLPPHIRAT